MKKVLLLSIILMMGAGKMIFSQPAEGELNAIQTVVPFLTIAPDSRAGGMGDAGVSTSPDVFSQHWNPAKYAFIDGNGGVGISYSPWLRNLVPDINLAYLSGYLRLDDRQVLSGSLLYSSLGDVNFTDDFGNPIRTFKPNEFSLDAAYSRLFSDHLAGSIAFRFIYSNLTGGFYTGGEATKPGISIAADISGYYRKEITIGSNAGEFAFGVNFSNIGSKMSYSDAQTSDFIPMNMRFGPSASIDLNEYNRITGTIDFNKLLVPTPFGKNPDAAVPVAFFSSFFDAPGGFKEELREITFSPGLEYWYNNQFALRGGYFHENETKGNRKFFTAGAGLKLNFLTLDFSYLMPLAQNHPLAQTLRFSLSFDISALRRPSNK
jgi:hypothetical protein